MANETIHDVLMQRCIQIAALGMGYTAPNPLVGAVIAHQQKIIGSGYHQRYGSAHAEVNAIRQVKDLSLLQAATLYVNLEPCCHFGKTPPCADLIIAHKIPRVVIAQRDPNPLVSGKGIQKLKEAGVEVIENVLWREAGFLNRRFNTFFEKKRPFIILKWAQSADGMISKKSDASTPISTKSTQKLVHKWRHEEAAILIGAQTAVADNPQLTDRFFDTEKQPLRILIDKNLRTPATSNLMNDKLPTLIFNQIKSELSTPVQYIKSDFKNPLQDLLAYLFDQKIQSILVEGGAITLQHFIDQNLWDEARIITNEKILGNGIKAPVLNGNKIGGIKIESDEIVILENPKTANN